MTSDKLTGGNSNQVYREGDTVVRQCGIWSPFVHALLNFLVDAGFEASPRLIESDGKTERLTYIVGSVGNDPLQPEMLTDAVLVEAAQLLRRFHDVTQAFVIPSDARFMLAVPDDVPREVICHNDFAPYNCVYHGGHIVGIIDFDTVALGSRLWDIAYAVYRFVPLMTDAHCRDMGWHIPPNRISRLQQFCDAYGLDNRQQLIDTVCRRITALMTYMQETQSNLDHLPFYETDLAYIRANQAQFERLI